MLSDQGEQFSDDIPTFHALGISDAICSRLHLLNWFQPTPIQCAAIQPALQGKDIVGVAETGSGKTGAFLLPIIQRWIDAGRPRGFGLLLAPTRELAHQLADEAIRLGACGDNPTDHLRIVRLVGGEDMVEQALQLAWHRHHLLVATPGRLVDHLKKSPNFAPQQLSQIRQLVLDEADQMLNMAFADDIDMVLNLYQKPRGRKKRRKSSIPLLDQIAKTNLVSNDHQVNSVKCALKTTDKKFSHPQTHLYSATMTKDVAKLRRAALSPDAVFVNGNCQSQPSVVAPVVTDASHRNDRQLQKAAFPPGLVQYCLPIRLADKPVVLDWLLQESTYADKEHFNATNLNCPSRALVFCKRCQETRLVSQFLRECGHSVASLSGRMKEVDRKQSLLDFVSGHSRILVATDVASRGLDIPCVELVINYSVPPSEKLYRHRVGRTARAGRNGVAVTLVSRDSASTFLEIEAKLLPYLSRDPVCISSDDGMPRWPIPLPGPSGRHGMLLRRRLAGEAWARAGKAIRMQDEEHRKTVSKLMDDASVLFSESDLSDLSMDSESSDDNDDDGDGTNVVVEFAPNTSIPQHIVSTKNSVEPFNTSGTDGLVAARLSWKVLKSEKTKKRRQLLEQKSKHETPSVGWGLNTPTEERADDIEDSDHLRLEESLKHKYRALPSSKNKVKSH